MDIYLQWKTNRKSYMAYQMAATAVTLNDLEGHSPVAGLLSAICRTFMQHFTRFQLTECSRSPCVRGASCMNRETTDKIIVYSTESGYNIRKALFVNLR